MATESSLQKVHVFPSEESYEENKGSIGENDIAFVPSADTSNGVPIVTTGGTGEAYTATVPSITSLKDGMMLVIIPHVASNATYPTLNINGLGASKIGRLSSYAAVLETGILQPGAYNQWLSANVPQLLVYIASAQSWAAVGMTRPEATELTPFVDTEYTYAKFRYISLQASEPGTIQNGHLVGVYE